jgi:HK97 family phage major capsid protein
VECRPGGVGAEDAPQESGYSGFCSVGALSAPPTPEETAMTDLEVNVQDLSAMGVDELRATHERILDALRNLHYDSRGEVRSDLDGDESAEYERLTRLADRVKGHVQLREQYARGVGVERAFGGSLVDRSLPSVASDDVLRMAVDTARETALRAVEHLGRGLDSRNQDRVDGLLRSTLSADNPNLDGSLIARRLLLTETPVYHSAWQRVVTEPHPVLTDEEARSLRAMVELDRYETRAMGDFTNSAGGYGIPVLIDPSIILSAQGSIAPIRELARTATVNTTVWKGVSSAGVTWAFQTEGAVASDNSPTLAQPTVAVHMARGFIPFSIEVQSDYPQFAQEMAQLLAAGYDELLANKLMTGTGTGEPRGLVNLLDATSASEVRLTTAGSVGGVDVDRVWEGLPDKWKARATWLASYGGLDQIASLSTINAGSIAYQTVDATGVVQTIRTRPAYPTSYGLAKVTSTATTNFAIVGDFSNYLIAQRAGMSVELVPMLFQQQTAGTGVGFPTGQRGWFAWGRVGGDVLVSDGFRLLNQT